MSLRSRIDRFAWSQRGYPLDDAEIQAIDDFFDPWFEVYNQPGVGAYRTAEAIFASQLAAVEMFPQLPDEGRKRKQCVSALRAGYVVAVTEKRLGMRPAADPNLRALFEAMSEDDGTPPDSAMAASFLGGSQLARVVLQMVRDRPEIAGDLPGFYLREWVFVDLRETLFVKIRLPERDTVFNRDDGVLALRLGHAVGVAEESLPNTHAPLGD